MFALEGYYDESGDLVDPASEIFVVSGYLIRPTAARKMDREWRAVLAHHHLPYFHMVDCAHEPPSGPFKGKTKDERIRIVGKLIKLIKSHTLEGVSLIARASTYKGPRTGESNIYTQFASACVEGAHILVDMHGPLGEVAYCFEDGHGNKSDAYRYISNHISRPGDSVAFAPKAEVPLLQAADLLAWQTAKYVKDYFYPFKVDKGKFKRRPRKDFQRLMKHNHAFMHFDMGSDSQVMGIETWPMKARTPFDQRIQLKD